MPFKILRGTLGGIIGAVADIIIGLPIGMNLGGNNYEDFVFNGLRGYEAVGQIGVIMGGLLGVVCGFPLTLFLVRRKGNKN
jgi:hypothetical protein